MTLTDEATRALRAAVVSGLRKKSRAGSRTEETSAAFSRSAGAGRAHAGTRSSGPAGGGLQAQVERALSDVLRRTPASSVALMDALDEVFPEGGSTPSVDGVVDLTTGRTAVSQSVLVRQVRRIVEDILPIVHGLRPRSGAVDVAEIEVLRKLVERQLEGLRHEVARSDGPRVRRVELLFTELRGADSSLVRLRSALEKEVEPNLRSLSDEAQRADLDHLAESVALAEEAWRKYLGKRTPGSSDLGDRMSEASLLLGVVGETLVNIREAAADIGFTTAEQRVMRLPNVEREDIERALDARKIKVKLPDRDDHDELTVADFFEWVENLAGPDGDRTVQELGEPGLKTVCRQADALFWILAGAIGAIELGNAPEALIDDRMDSELRSLLEQLDDLAGQGA